jgi:hypothetical protein
MIIMNPRRDRVGDQTSCAQLYFAADQTDPSLGPRHARASLLTWIKVQVSGLSLVKQTQAALAALR